MNWVRNAPTWTSSREENEVDGSKSVSWFCRARSFAVEVEVSQRLDDGLTLRVREWGEDYASGALIHLPAHEASELAEAIIELLTPAIGDGGDRPADEKRHDRGDESGGAESPIAEYERKRDELRRKRGWD